MQVYCFQVVLRNRLNETTGRPTLSYFVLLIRTVSIERLHDYFAAELVLSVGVILQIASYQLSVLITLHDLAR